MSKILHIPNDIKKILIVSLLNLVLYHYPLYKYVVSKLDISEGINVFFLLSLVVFVLIFNSIVFYIVLFLLRKIGKWLLIFLFNISAIAVYFINTYGIVINKAMISNVLNSKLQEVNGFWSISLFVYIILFGILPSLSLIHI